MKKNSLTALYSFVMFLFIPLSVIAQEAYKVAVFDPAGSVEEALREIVREEISSVVVNTAGFTVLERQLINKVLEENRFQESGLVNDEQVSDIGKRMGADFVFVTTISTLGANYYISCKMIEVATARIDKQSTGTTTNGINDIPQTTQYIVRRLFGENVQQQVVNRPVQPTSRTTQAAVTPRNTTVVNDANRTYSPAQTTTYRGVLVVNRSSIYSDGRALSRQEVRATLANTDALQYYSSAVKNRTTGIGLSTMGSAAIVAGTITIIAYKVDGAWENSLLTIGGSIVGTGIALVIPGLILIRAGNRNISRAVDVYNSDRYSYSEPPSSFEIDFGITSSGGIGLVMRF